MIEDNAQHALLILYIGTASVLSILIKSLASRIGIPPLVGYIFLGFLIRFLDWRYGFLSTHSESIFEFLAQIGVIILLFRVGLESKLGGLKRQLRRASVIWPGGVIFSGLLGYAAASWFLGFDVLPGLFIGTALTATSVGVSVKVWEEMNALQSKTGQVLVDVAELDDISGVILMALLFSLIPVLHNGLEGSLLSGIAAAAGEILLHVLLFGFFVLLLALYAEKRLMTFFRHIEAPPDPILTVAGMAFIIASLAGMLGLSLAIGAFFAGLVFSREPESLKIDAPFNTLYNFFCPFFFIGIGLDIDPEALKTAAGPGMLLFLTACLGKFLGHGVPAYFTVGRKESLMIGASMIPRAEIAMIIMQRGLKLGPWAVPDKGFAAMVVVSMATCITGPMIVRWLFPRIRKGDGTK